MKQLLGLIAAVVCLFLGSPVYASDSDIIKVEVIVSKYVPATECYVVFFMESSGPSMAGAKENCDRKLQEFSTRCNAEFPQVKLDVLSVNVGTKDFKPTFGDSKDPIVPTVGKVIICTLSPDEDMALRLLDFGIKSGLTPFCSSSSADDTFGAVYYGVKNPEKPLAELYAVGAKKLWDQAERLAEILKVGQLKMNDISDDVSPRRGFKIKYRGVEIVLPAKFCGGDKDRIDVFLVLIARFSAVNPSSE